MSCHATPCHRLPTNVHARQQEPGRGRAASRRKSTLRHSGRRPPPHLSEFFLQTRAVSTMDATTAIATAAGICLAARTTKSDAGATAKHCSISPHIEPAGGFHGNRAHGGRAGRAVAMRRRNRLWASHKGRQHDLMPSRQWHRPHRRIATTAARRRWAGIAGLPSARHATAGMAGKPSYGNDGLPAEALPRHEIILIFHQSGTPY